MLHSMMEADVIKGLGPLADSYSHSKAVAYFEEIKSSNQGLELCATYIAQDTYQEDYVKFFLWQVLEQQVKYRHNGLPENLRVGLRTALLTWLQNYSKQASAELPKYVRNKAAQVFAMVFAKEYISGWTTFIQDVMFTSLGENPFTESVSEKGRDIYLRILLAIDSEVVDRSVEHSAELQNHHQLLKDTMRERCVKHLVDSWFCILFKNAKNECIATCLKVVGAYITWIDIGLIANQRFMELIFGYLGNTHPLATREEACDCLKEISLKGMLPLDKLALVETLWGALVASSILSVADDDNEDIDFVIKLSRLVAAMASTLITSWHKLSKACPNVASNDEVSVLLAAIHSKVPTCLKMFSHEDDDVSAQCVDFMRDYIDLQKKMQGLGLDKAELFHELFRAVVKKLKYDLDYNFSSEGETEVEFQEYLRNIKIIYDNLSLLAPELALQNVHAVVSESISKWQVAPFNDVEVAIRILYMLGESLPSNLSAHFSTEKDKNYPLYEMMTLLVSCGVSNHSHPAVRLQFFETVARYDRYFPVAASEMSQVVASTAQAFLDHRGLRSSCSKVRSRCAYLFSRFVKTVGKLLTPFAEEILAQIYDLVVLSADTGVERALSCDDQLFIYELAGHVIVSSNFDASKKSSLMTTLLRPLVDNFQSLLVKMKEAAASESNLPQAQHSKAVTESELYANTLNYVMSYASRTSKAFSNKQTMSQSGCAHVYTDALKVFLMALDTNVHKQILHTGVRQYLHRMVICLEDEVLPFVPVTVRHLLSNDQCRSLHDFIPLLNQIVNKFKKLIEPFLQEVFMLVVRAVFELLSRHNGDASARNDEDAKAIRRTYFQFLLALVTNGVANVILGQALADLEMVLSTLIQGASDFPDPASQKICFTILTRLVEAWDPNSGIPLWNFVTKSVIPVCFHAPLKSTFDLSDAQTVLALNESSYLLKAIYSKQGNEMESFLRQEYLPSLNTAPELIEDYCRALSQLNNREFRSYLKAFFARAKT